MRKENPDYAKIIFHKGLNINSSNNEIKDSLGKYKIMHDFFYVEGEYPFGKLNLLRYHWNKIHSVNDKKEPQVIASVQDKKIFEGTDEDYKKTLIFESKKENGLIVMQLNTKIHYHEIDISANKNENENPGIIKRAKSMLEEELK
ncbi:MAG: hypothetical protein NTZ83_05010, partial [Candidatus Pacearchaeota archaeon]|nr:hypothetical protein [Candidatus Pacearchaeota archaeon]